MIFACLIARIEACMRPPFNHPVAPRATGQTCRRKREPTPRCRRFCDDRRSPGGTAPRARNGCQTRRLGHRRCRRRPQSAKECGRTRPDGQGRAAWSRCRPPLSAGAAAIERFVQRQPSHPAPGRARRRFATLSPIGPNWRGEGEGAVLSGWADRADRSGGAPSQSAAARNPRCIRQPPRSRSRPLPRAQARHASGCGSST